MSALGHAEALASRSTQRTAGLGTDPIPRFPSALIDRLHLADGREVVVRPVLALDAEAEQDFVRALSPATRLRRFHFGLRELPPSMLRAMTEVDHDDHVAIVAEAFDDDDEDQPRIVADARYVRGPREVACNEAEFAIAVADAWQGVGLGRALMQRLVRHAARRGVCHLVGDVLPGNVAMFGIAAALGGEREASPNGPGVTRVRFDLKRWARVVVANASTGTALGRWHGCRSDKARAWDSEPSAGTSVQMPGQRAKFSASWS